MLNDYDLFIQLCQKRGILPPTKVSDAIKLSSSTGELRLSCLSIIVPICEVLSQVISSSSTIKVVDLADCMLLAKGLTSILNALCEGSVVSSLNLKGNNISGPTTEQLGQVFIRNNILKRLHVEWNSIGAQSNSFYKFCEGLCKNHNIEELDLRYNQISPHCAESLYKLIKHNKTLKSIDLAWNTLGLQGGTLILEAMKENKTLMKVDLRGNCIPNNVVQAIENRTYENQCRKTMCKSNISRSLTLKENARPISLSDSDSETRVTSKHLRKKTRKKQKATVSVKSSSESENGMENSLNSDSEIRITSSPVEKHAKSIPGSSFKSLVEASATSKNIDATEMRIEELNLMLQERIKVIDLLTKELAEKTNETEAVKLQIAKLQLEIQNLKEDLEKEKINKEKELEELKRVHVDSEENQLRACKELQDSFDKLVQSKKELEMTVRRYERDIRKSSSDIFGLKEKLSSSTQAYEDLISRGKTEIHKLRRESKEKEIRHKIELNMLKNALKETTQALEECQIQLHKSRGEIRELTDSETSMKEKLSELERVVARCFRYEENFQKVKEEKESLEEKYGDAQRNLASLQRQVAALQAELIEPQRKYDLLKDELEQEKRRCVRREQEISEERARMKVQDDQIQKMTVQIGNLNTRINEIQESHSEVLKERDKEKQKLQESIARKERDFNELKAEEVQRASQLYAAFNKYLGSIGQNPVS